MSLISFKYTHMFYYIMYFTSYQNLRLIVKSFTCLYSNYQITLQNIHLRFVSYRISCILKFYMFVFKLSDSVVEYSSQNILHWNKDTFMEIELYISTSKASGIKCISSFFSFTHKDTSLLSGFKTKGGKFNSKSSRKWKQIYK